MTYRQQRLYRADKLRAERKGEEIAPTSLVSGTSTAADAAAALSAATAAAVASGTPASAVAVLSSAATATSNASNRITAQQQGQVYQA